MDFATPSQDEHGLKEGHLTKEVIELGIQLEICPNLVGLGTVHFIILRFSTSPRVDGQRCCSQAPTRSHASVVRSSTSAKRVQNQPLAQNILLWEAALVEITTRALMPMEPSFKILPATEYSTCSGVILPVRARKL